MFLLPFSNQIQTFPLIMGWALKHNHKYGRKGGGKRLSLDVVEVLKRLFMTGQEDPSNRYSPKDMLMVLKEMAEDGELTTEEIPTEKSIDSWISRYSRASKRELAKRTLGDNVDNENSEESEVNDRSEDEEQPSSRLGASESKRRGKKRRMPYDN